MSDVLQRTVGPIGAKLAAGAHRAVGAGLPQPGDADRSPGDLRHGAGRPFLPEHGAARRHDQGRRRWRFCCRQAVWTGVLALSGSYDQILSYVISMNFLFFGLSASCLFVLRRREAVAGGAIAAGYRAPLHPWTTGLFILACIGVVGCSFWAYPVNSLIGYALLALGLAAVSVLAPPEPDQETIMTLPERTMQSDYMNFAKLKSGGDLQPGQQRRRRLRPGRRRRIDGRPGAAWGEHLWLWPADERDPPNASGFPSPAWSCPAAAVHSPITSPWRPCSHPATRCWSRIPPTSF